MHFKRLRRRFHKTVKVQQKQVESLSQATEKSIERNIFKRFGRLKPVRRFVFGWVALILLIMGCLIAQFQQLSAYYQKVEPVPGGIYTEGMIGSISNLSPIYATSDVDRSLSRLIFAGLLRTDASGNIVPNLASTYDVTDNGKLHTLKLKPGLTWHDGRPITSADVVFTINTIKEPDARSPLFASWQNVTVEAPDAQTVVFTLRNALAPFNVMLTTGIIPQHVLGGVSAANMRSADFNTINPVGAGPFKLRALQVTGTDPAEVEEQVALLPFDKYAAGTPKLNEMIMRIYTSQERLRQAFASGQLTAAAGLDAPPQDVPNNSVKNDMLMGAGTYTFFKNSSPIFSSVKVRQAMVAAANPAEVIDKLDYMTKPVVSPLLTGQLAFNKDYAQKTNDVATAKRLLSEDGWQPTLAGGKLTKDGKPLQFTFVAADTPEYRMVSNVLKKQWEAIGAKVNLQLLTPAEYGTALAGHEYDATLYGIAIGDDPDVYAYWASSQADVRAASRLNLSEWKNTTADTALEAGRTRTDGQLRAVKYAPFLQAWQQEAPALGLYQPRFLYMTRGQVHGLTNHSLASSVDRFRDVHNWQIRTARVTAD